MSIEVVWEYFNDVMLTSEINISFLPEINRTFQKFETNTFLLKELLSMIITDNNRSNNQIPRTIAEQEFWLSPSTPFI